MVKIHLDLGVIVRGRKIVDAVSLVVGCAGSVPGVAGGQSAVDGVEGGVGVIVWEKSEAML